MIPLIFCLYKFSSTTSLIKYLIIIIICLYTVKYSYLMLIFSRGIPYGIMDKVLDCGFEVSKFELQLCYYIHFLTNTIGKNMNPLILSAMG